MAQCHPPGWGEAALNRFTRYLAAEIAGSGVTADVIHPGEVAENYVTWADWVEQTGGDPPEKAAALVLRLTSDTGGRVNGEFCWVEDPLQAPVSGWDPPSDERPWMKE